MLKTIRADAFLKNLIVLINLLAVALGIIVLGSATSVARPSDLSQARNVLKALTLATIAMDETGTV